MVWAILSGIEGNLAAYKAVIKDIRRQPLRVEEIYILGDLIGPRQESEALVQYIRESRSPSTHICQGWWEEQLFSLHGLRRDSDAIALREKHGTAAIEQLWNAVSRDTTNWLRGLDFGFFELDCLLIHGSTVGCDDELTPETNPLTLLDRLLRSEANTIFCGRSGLTFQYQLASAQITSTVTTLGAAQNADLSQPQTLKPRQIVGVGNVGRRDGHASYTLYNPFANTVQFRPVTYGESPRPVTANQNNTLSGRTP